MKPLAERWYEGCSKKRPYFKESLAREICVRSETERLTPLRAYKCEFCPAWHVTKQLTFVNKENVNEMV